MKRRQAGVDSVMVRATFSAVECRHWLCQQKATFRRRRLYDVLISSPFANFTYDTGLIFQQDNPSIHFSHRSQKFVSEEGINIYDLPSKSSDLNPIKKLWYPIDRQVHAIIPQSERFLIYLQI